MKYLVMVKPGPMPPPIEMVRAGREWVEEKRSDGTFEAAYAFPEGGGMSISEHDSHDELMDTLIDYPLSPFVQFEVKPMVELESAFDRFESVAEKVGQMMAGAAS